MVESGHDHGVRHAAEDGLEQRFLLHQRRFRLLALADRELPWLQPVRDVLEVRDRESVAHDVSSRLTVFLRDQYRGARPRRSIRPHLDSQ